MSNRNEHIRSLETRILRELTTAERIPSPHRKRHEALSCEDLANFLRVYGKITDQDGLTVCKSPPLEIFLQLVTSHQMMMSEDELLSVVAAPAENVRRWIRVLVEKGVVIESTNTSGNLYSVAPDYVADYLFRI